MQLTGKSKVLQIHPTRRCNLRCQHCYSASSPDIQDELSIHLLLDAVTDAVDLSYNVVSLSGGEPLLYSSLRELLHHAHSKGCLTTVTTNGMLLNQQNLEKLQGVTDLVAISLDGIPASHNRNRGSRHAFEMMQSRLAGLRESEIPFGFIFTLTQYNLPELEWVTQFACKQGAKLLQIHPLELAGRAAELLLEEKPDSLEMSIAYLEAARLQELVGDQLFVQVDIVNQAALKSNPAVLETLPKVETIQFSDIISHLVLEADGIVVPLQYGLSRQFALGNLHDARLKVLADVWLKHQLPEFQALCQQAFSLATALPETKFMNLYEIIGQVSQRSMSAV